LSSALKASSSLETIHVQQPRPFDKIYHMLQGVMVVCLPVLYIADQLIASPILHNALNWYILGLVLLLIPSMRGFMLYMSSALILVGLLIFLGKNISYQSALASVSLNLALVSVFLSVPLLGISVRAGGYLEVLRSLYTQHLRSIPAFFIMTQLLTHILGIFLNIGAVTIFHYLSQANPHVKSQRILGTALIRGFSMTVIWSPFFAAMALVVAQLNTAWKDIVWYLLGFVAINFLVSIAVEWRHFQNSGHTGSESSVKFTATKQVDTPKGWYKIYELVFLLTLIVFLAFSIEYVLPIGLVVSICLMSQLFPPLWLLAKRRITDYKREWFGYFSTTIPLLRKEVVLFLASGFFSAAVAVTSFGDWFTSFLIGMFNGFEIGILLFICVSIIGFSTLGFHPIVIITVYITSVNPELLGFTPAYFAVLLLGSWGIVTNFSPMTAVSHLLSNLLKVPVIDVSIRWNLVYTFILIICLVLYLYGLKTVGLI
jgi:DcuC family C4-dicarboxylate transporter